MTIGPHCRQRMLERSISFDQVERAFLHGRKRPSKRGMMIYKYGSIEIVVVMATSFVATCY